MKPVHKGRRRGPGFFVADHDKINRGTRYTVVKEPSQRSKSQYKTALHIDHAGSVGDAVSGPVRPGSNCTQIKNRIRMTQKDDPAGQTGHVNPEMTDIIALAPFNPVVGSGESLGDLILHGKDSGRIIAAGINIDQRLNQLQVFVQAFCNRFSNCFHNSKGIVVWITTHLMCP